jgi:molybdopterin molybdotransferase
MNDVTRDDRSTYRDPRERGFRSRTSVDDVLEMIAARVGPLEAEDVRLAEACGRVLVKGVVAAGAVPPFDRAAMDGLAVHGEETFGAGAYCPAVFRIIGRSRPGRRFDGTVGPGEAVEIATGAPMPAGADAVVPIEATQRDPDQPIIRVVEAIPPGRHVGARGEDIMPGATVLGPHRTLRPQDLGILSASGMAVVPVVRGPRVTILVTGDELLPAGSAPVEGDSHITDMNSVMVAALVTRDGGSPRVVGPLTDDRGTLRSALADAAADSDAVLISGGSSTGPEDHAPGLVAELGELAVHGVAVRPASPAGLGFLGRVPVLLLPGNPVSCLCAYDLFGGQIVRRLGGRRPEWPYRPVERPLAHKLTSALGRVDYTRVRLVNNRVEPLAVGGASILSGTTRADGFLLVPAGLEGYPAGAVVTVWLFDYL